MNIKRLIIDVNSNPISIYLKDIYISIDNINMIQFRTKTFDFYYGLDKDEILGTFQNPNVWGVIDDGSGLYYDFRDLMIGNDNFVKVNYKKSEYYINKSRLKSYEYTNGYGYELQFICDSWLGLCCKENILEDIIR